MRHDTAPASPLVLLRRSVHRLVAHAQQLEGRLEAGDASAWPEYRETLQTLALVAVQGQPERDGALLTTAEMAARLQISPKTLLKHKRRGAVRPALVRGKLIRWRGTEATH